MQELENCRVAIIATDGVEEVELIEPRKALDQAGARTEVIAPSQARFRGSSATTSHPASRWIAPSTR